MRGFAKIKHFLPTNPDTEELRESLILLNNSWKTGEIPKYWMIFMYLRKAKGDKPGE